MLVTTLSLFSDEGNGFRYGWGADGAPSLPLRLPVNLDVALLLETIRAALHFPVIGIVKRQ
jgi:hypothetical protein